MLSVYLLPTLTEDIRPYLPQDLYFRSLLILPALFTSGSPLCFFSDAAFFLFTYSVAVALQVYTRWKNLKKLDTMAVGQIGYHDLSKQRRIRIEKV